MEVFLHPSLPVQSPNALSYLFVRGYWKSGTTWLARMLNLHPHIRVSWEYHWQPLLHGLEQLLATSNAIVARPEHGFRDSFRQEIQALIKRTMESHTREHEKIDPAHLRWIGDKSPAPIEPLILEGGLTINMLRDGRDVVVSMFYNVMNGRFFQHYLTRFPSLQGKQTLFQADPQVFLHQPDLALQGEEPFVRHIAAEWSHSIFQSVASAERAQRGELPASLVQLRYEDLHREPEATRNRLFALLGVDVRLSAPLDDKTRAGFKKEKPTNFNRKGQTGDWMNYFQTETRASFKEAGQAALEQFSWAENAAW